PLRDVEIAGLAIVAVDRREVEQSLALAGLHEDGHRRISVQIDVGDADQRVAARPEGLGDDDGDPARLLLGDQDVRLVAHRLVLAGDAQMLAVDVPVGHPEPPRRERALSRAGPARAQAREAEARRAVAERGSATLASAA